MTDPEPVFSIYQVFESRPLCETIGVTGLMETMGQLAPNLYEIRRRGRVVATGWHLSDGYWSVEFFSGVILAPGCMIV
jgi:hypothetical protein